MRLTVDLPDDRQRRDMDVPDHPTEVLPDLPSPPPADALAVRMERNEHLAKQSTFTNIARPRHVNLPASPEVGERPRVERRPRRDYDPRNDVGIGIHLRPQEIKALTDVACFRVVNVRDLADNVYSGDRSALERDLSFLAKKGILSVHSVRARRDGTLRQPERLQVVTLTRPGKDLVREVAGLRSGQQIYAGLVKPREVEHDTQIYRAYLKELDRIEKLGGTNPRVTLDFQIKRNVQSAIYAERKAEPERNLNEIKEQVACQFDLPYVDNHIQSLMRASSTNSIRARGPDLPTSKL